MPAGLDLVGAPVALLDEHGVVVRVNQAWRNVAAEGGAQPQDPQCGVGANYLAVCEAAVGVDAFGARAVAEGIRGVLSGQYPTFSLDYPCNTANGTRWFRVTVSPRRRGKIPRGAVVMHLEVTGRHALEWADTPGEEHYRVLFDHSPQPMWVVDRETQRFLAVNEAAVAQYGHPRKAFLNMTLQDIRVSESGTAEQECAPASEQGYRHRGLWSHRTADGRILSVEVSTHNITFAGRPARLGLLQDITARLATERTLEASRASLRQASRLTQLGAWKAELPHLQVALLDEADTLAPNVPRVLANAAALAVFIPAHRDVLNRAMATCLGQRTPFDLEMELAAPAPDGRPVWVRLVGAPMVDAAGRLLGVQGAFQVISERKEMERKLHEQDALLRQAGKIARLGAWAVEKEDLRLFVSEEVCAALDFPEGSLPTLDQVRALYPKGFRRRLGAELLRCFRDGRAFDVEVDLVSAQGRPMSVRLHGEPQRDADGQIRRVVGALQDITERHLAARRESDLAQRLATTLESLADAFFTLDRDWRFTYLNAEAERLLRRRRQDLLGKDLWAEFPRGEHNLWAEAYLRAVETQKPVEFEDYQAAVGMWLGVRAYPSALGLAVHLRDVTDARRVSEALYASGERFRFLARATNDVIWDWNMATDALWWNDGMEALFGLRRSEVESTMSAWLERVHPDDRPKVQQGIQEAIRSGAERWDGAFRFWRHDGSHAHVEARGHIIRDADGKALRMMAGMTDVSARKVAEHRLAKQARLLDAATEAILVQDLDGRVTFWNKGAERTYGWPQEEALGRDFAALCQADPARWAEAMAAIHSHGEWHGDMVHRTRQGSRRDVEVRWSMVRDDAGSPASILGILSDVTERKGLEQQFLRAQRLESIGTLASGIAHDLNNVLTPILMSLDMLRMDEDRPQRLADMGTMEASARRGAGMVQQLLSFARGMDGGGRDRVLPSLVVGEVAVILQETFPKSMTMRLNVAADAMPMMGDATQLNQVLLNLCVNARDAMPQGGTLEVSVENAQVAELPAGTDVRIRPGPFVLIRVRDTGSGMTRAVQERLFEPFFTTKAMGKGTGLGLFTAHVIIKGHGGFIQVESEPGQGTTVKVYVPAASTLPQPTTARASTAETPVGSGQLVLLVDDEESIRNMGQRILNRFGYRTLVAADGAEALALYARHRDQVAVVITDMDMPNMDGVALLEQLRAVDPAVKAVGSSGLNLQPGSSKMARAGFQRFLPKPYTADTLLQVLRSVLGGPLSAGTPAA